MRRQSTAGIDRAVDDRVLCVCVRGRDPARNLRNAARPGMPCFFTIP
jgi:hypothetical protein